MPKFTTLFTLAALIAPAAAYSAETCGRVTELRSYVHKAEGFDMDQNKTVYVSRKFSFKLSNGPQQNLESFTLTESAQSQTHILLLVTAYSTESKVCIETDDYRNIVAIKVTK